MRTGIATCTVAVLAATSLTLAQGTRTGTTVDRIREVLPQLERWMPAGAKQPFGQPGCAPKKEGAKAHPDPPRNSPS